MSDKNTQTMTMPCCGAFVAIDPKAPVEVCGSCGTQNPLHIPKLSARDRQIAESAIELGNEVMKFEFVSNGDFETFAQALKMYSNKLKPILAKIDAL